MSHEAQALEEYMNQQQLRINELTQAMVLLQTRNALLEKELIKIRGYAYDLPKESPVSVERNSVKTIIHSKLIEGERISRLAPKQTTDRFKPKHVLDGIVSVSETIDDSEIAAASILDKES
jgi:hypothetical protein